MKVRRVMENWRRGEYGREKRNNNPQKKKVKANSDSDREAARFKS
jgi:hypothetical protein